MKAIMLVAAALVLGALAVFGYEFYQDTRLGGMPRKTVSVALTIFDRAPLVARYRAFAQSHGFDFEDHREPGAALYLRMTRWNAEIDIWSPTRFSAGRSAEDPSHLAIWVKFKGWLWWTDFAAADALASELAGITRAADPRAPIAIRTNDPLWSHSQ